jgi:hypothetical protein
LLASGTRAHQRVGRGRGRHCKAWGAPWSMLAPVQFCLFRPRAWRAARGGHGASKCVHGGAHTEASTHPTRPPSLLTCERLSPLWRQPSFWPLLRNAMSGHTRSSYAGRALLSTAARSSCRRRSAHISPLQARAQGRAAQAALCRLHVNGAFQGAAQLHSNRFAGRRSAVCDALLTLSQRPNGSRLHPPRALGAPPLRASRAPAPPLQPALLAHQTHGGQPSCAYAQSSCGSCGLLCLGPIAIHKTQRTHTTCAAWVHGKRVALLPAPPIPQRRITKPARTRPHKLPLRAPISPALLRTHLHTAAPPCTYVPQEAVRGGPESPPPGPSPPAPPTIGAPASPWLLPAACPRPHAPYR